MGVGRSVGYRPAMTDETKQTGHLDDDAEQAQESSTTEGAAAAGQYDAAQGSPDGGAHPTGETFPDEGVRYGEDERRRSEGTDSAG